MSELGHSRLRYLAAGRPDVGCWSNSDKRERGRRSLSASPEVNVGNEPHSALMPAALMIGHHLSIYVRFAPKRP